MLKAFETNMGPIVHANFFALIHFQRTQRTIFGKIVILIR
jgi:hypothetical protein